MRKVLNPAKFVHYNNKKYDVFIVVKFENGILSITGVESPMPSGNCRGGCGQIVNNIPDYIPAKGWTKEMLNTLQFIWNTYHLNDLTPNCQHMRDAGKLDYESGYVCPVCGYESGSKWLSRTIPADVITWLESLPESEKIPAWC